MNISMKSEYNIRMKAGDIVRLGKPVLDKFEKTLDDMIEEFIDMQVRYVRKVKRRKFFGLIKEFEPITRKEAIEYLDHEYHWNPNITNAENLRLEARGKFHGCIELIESAQVCDPDFEIEVPGRLHRMLTRN